MSHIRILINVLDNEAWILDLIKDIFSDDQIYDVHVYTEPEPFIKAFSIDTDLVITDIRVQGYDVVENLKLFAKINPGCYMVVISAYLDDLYDALINECHVDRTVEKTHDIAWIQLLRDRVDSLKPRILGKSKFISTHA